MSDELEYVLARVALQDRRAFRELYARTSAKLFGICLRLLRERSEAEDALQETYVKIWRSAGQFATGVSSPMPWLIAIARNTSIDRMRGRRAAPVPLEDAEVIPDESPGPEQRLTAAADLNRLRACLGELDPPRADAVAAAYIDGFSYQEITDRHNIPLNTVRTWLRRGLAKLRDCLRR